MATINMATISGVHCISIKSLFKDTRDIMRRASEPELMKQANWNESMVSFVSRRYMRVVNGILVVCLSEYLPLRSVYILVIKVDFHI